MLEKFNNFLKNINLDKYREKYKSIKTMEADMNRDIQALESIYNAYWVFNHDEFPCFEDFYKKYYLTNDMEQKIKEFNINKIGLCEECLMKGVEARIYRTWASLITQIQAGYCCSKVFGNKNVFQSTELDHMGIDIKITYKNKNVGIQIKKETGRREIANRKPTPKEQKEFSKIYDINYKVITEKEYFNPKYKTNHKNHKIGDYKNYAYLFGLDGSEPYLKRLNNGFVIFTEKSFEEIKRDLDKDLDF